MRRKPIQTVSLLSTSAICLLVATRGHAAAAADGAAVGLQEVVVTAQKRSENLQNVPVTITAVSGAELRAANIKSARDLTVAVPGLVQSQAGGTTQTFLRGIGTTITQVNADPSIATYIDGVYQSLSMVSSVKLSDIQSVEVLKGPQGTLYGRNATGGAISITTRSPTDKFEATGLATYGNYDRHEFGASVSGPVANHLYLGVYGDYEGRHPYSKLENFGGTPRPDVRSTDFQWDVRGKLVYDNDENFRAVLAGDITKYGALQDMAYQQLQPDAEAYGTATIGRPAVPNTRRYSFSTNVPVDDHWTSEGGSLRLEYRVAGVKLVSITAYRNNSAYLRTDSDATEAVVAVTDTALSNFSKQTTQEIQVQSDTSGPLKWIVGGFYYHDAGRLDPLQIFPPPLSQTISAGVNTTSYSAYGQLDWSISSRWSATLGGRYTDETKDYTGSTLIGSFAPAPPTTTTFPARSAHYAKFNPKVGAQYHFDGGMLYASYSQAFKSGAFNLTGTTPTAIGPVNPEKLTAYEVGVKSEMFDRTLRVNASLFHYKYDNLQVQTFSGTTLALQNAAEAHYDGLDFDAVWAVTSRLQLSAKALLEDGLYDSFPAYAGYEPRNPATNSTRGGNITVPGGVDLTGHRTARTPKFTGTLTGTYRQPLANGAQLAFNGLVYHSSAYSFVPDGTLMSAPYTTLDASVEYTSPNGAWAASLWAKNVTGTYYFNYMQVNGNGTYGIPAAPRTFGVTVSVKVG